MLHRIQYLIQYFLLSLLIFLLGCHSSHKTALPLHTSAVIKEAKAKGFTQTLIPTRPFLLTSLHAIQADSLIAYVFIEGDGKSWKTKYRLSDNPTPHQPLALKLAVLTQSLAQSSITNIGMLSRPSVIYLARPCQYTPLALDLNCHAKYWSSHRYATEVIIAMDEALDYFKTQSACSHFILIGFSGGASVATLLAAKRQDIIGLITIAGDLDNTALNKYHQTTPLYGSLNPIDVLPKLGNLPQIHWSGGKDKVVPVWMGASFVKRLHSPCAQHHVLQDADHHQQWEANWETILNTPLNCTSNKN